MAQKTHKFQSLESNVEVQDPCGNLLFYKP